MTKTYIINHKHETLIGGLIPTTYIADTRVEANDEDEAKAKLLAEWRPEINSGANNFYGAALGVPQDIPTQSKGVEILSIEAAN